MSEELIDLSPVAALYSESLERHGATPMGAGWRTASSQRLRFDKLLGVVDEDTALFSVNDLGCGYGALFHHLRRRGFGVSSYFGYDISHEMLAAARSRVPADQATFITSDRVTRKADYSFASGIFNVKLDVDDGRWARHVEATVRDLADHSQRGFAFNLLTTYSDYQEDDLFYADPTRWFDWCKRDITPRVSLLHDYPLFEWTLLGRTA